MEDRSFCFCGLIDMVHGMYGNLAANQMPCTYLQRASGNLDVFTDCDCDSAYDPSHHLADPNWSYPGHLSTAMGRQATKEDRPLGST